MGIETAKVKGRRNVSYATYEEFLAEAEKFSRGEAKTLGNWTPGQIYRHLAMTMNASIDGFAFQFPVYFRLMGWLLRNKIMTGKMPPGFQVPPTGEASLIPGPTSAEDGLADLHRAVARLRKDPKRVPHPVVGTINLEQWDRMHLKHAEMHMSFIHPA